MTDGEAPDTKKVVERLPLDVRRPLSQLGKLRPQGGALALQVIVGVDSQTAQTFATCAAKWNRSTGDPPF